MKNLLAGGGDGTIVTSTVFTRQEAMLCRTVFSFLYARTSQLKWLDSRNAWNMKGNLRKIEIFSSSNIFSLQRLHISSRKS